MSSITAPVSEIMASLFGALRLARGDTGGMAYFNITHEGFWRSFTAAIIIAPLFVALLAVRYTVNDADMSLLRFATVETIAYVIGWTAFPLLLFFITDFLGLGKNFIRYIVAYNWASVWQNLIYLPFALLVEAHMIQGAGSSFILFLLLALVMFYTWFITHTALEISNFMAVGLVMIDLMLSIFIAAITESMLQVT